MPRNKSNIMEQINIMKNLRIMLVAMLLIIPTFLSAQESTSIYEVVNVDYIDVRSQPTVSSGLLGRVRTGDLVKVEDIQSGWAEISYRGKTAYVQSQNLKKIAVSTASEQTASQHAPVAAAPALKPTVVETPAKTSSAAPVASKVESKQEDTVKQTSVSSKAGTTEMIGSMNYQHFFLKDDADMIKYSGGALIELGADYYVTESIYVGGSLAYSLAVITSEFSEISSWSEIHDLRIPLRVGMASSDSKFKLDTGPFIDFTIAGKTEITYGSMSDRDVTKLKDMNVKRVSFGWGVDLLVFDFLSIGYGIKITDSAYGEGGDTHMIRVGWSF